MSQIEEYRNFTATSLGYLPVGESQPARMWGVMDATTTPPPAYPAISSHTASPIDYCGHVLDMTLAFKRLAAQWAAETMAVSSISDIVLNWSYQQIIGMGMEVVPLILKELMDNGGYWYWALSAITGQNPAHEGSTIRELRAAWIRWGLERRLI
jgi:hypothetical protein